MKPYRHPKDDPAFLLKRTIGKKRRNWKVAAVAKGAPHELDTVRESLVHDQLEAEIQESGKPYLSLRERTYYWLKRMVAAGHFEAVELLDMLKDFPDLMVFDAEPGKPWSACLPLEAKRGKGGKARPGQKRLAETIGGTIAHGYTACHAALERFLKRHQAEGPSEARNKGNSQDT